MADSQDSQICLEAARLAASGFGYEAKPVENFGDKRRMNCAEPAVLSTEKLPAAKFCCLSKRRFLPKF
jgi:hypothetical protein